MVLALGWSKLGSLIVSQNFFTLGWRRLASLIVAITNAFSFGLAQEGVTHRISSKHSGNTNCRGDRLREISWTTWGKHRAKGNAMHEKGCMVGSDTVAGTGQREKYTPDTVTESGENKHPDMLFRFGR